MTHRYNILRSMVVSRWFALPILLFAAFAQAVECDWQYTNQWNGGATAELHATNNTDSIVNLNELTAEFAAGATVQNAWNAGVSGSNPYTFAPYSWNQQLQPGGSMYVGMQITLPSGSTAEDHIPELGGDCVDEPVPEGSLGLYAKDKILAGSTDRINVTISHPSRPPGSPSLSVSPYVSTSYMSSTGSSGGGSGYILGYDYLVSYDNPGTYLWRSEYEPFNLVTERLVEVFPADARPTVNYQVPDLIYAGEPFSFTVIGEDTEMLEALTFTPPSDTEFTMQSTDHQSNTLWTDIYTGALPQGEYLFVIEAEDPDGFSLRKTVTVNVLPAVGVNTPPVANIYSAADATANETVSFAATIKDAENNIVSASMTIFQIVNGERTNPQERINQDYQGTGNEILRTSWSTTTVGEYELEVIATDAEGERGVDVASFTVFEDVGGSVSISATAKVIVGERQQVSVSASHPTRPPYGPSLSVEPEATIEWINSGSSGGMSGGYLQGQTFGITYDYPGTYLLTASSAGIEPAETTVEVLPESARPTASIEVPEEIYENEEFSITVIAEDTEALESISLSQLSSFTLQSSDHSLDTYWVETYTGSLAEGTYSFSVLVEDSDGFIRRVYQSVEVQAVEVEPPEALWCNWYGYEVPVCEDQSLTDFQWINNALCIGYSTCGDSRLFTR